MCIVSALIEWHLDPNGPNPNVPLLNVWTWMYYYHVLLPYVHAYWKDSSIGKNHSNYPAYAPEHHTLTDTQRSHTVFPFFPLSPVNMTDRVKAAGRCVDGVWSHQSSNLSLGILPAECLSPCRPLCHTVLLLVSVLIRHSLYKPVYVQNTPKACCKARDRVKGERWGGRQRRGWDE